MGRPARPPRDVGAPHTRNGRCPRARAAQRDTCAEPPFPGARRAMSPRKKRPPASGLARRLRPLPSGIPPVGSESQWISSRFVGAGVRFGNVSVSTPFS